MHELSARLTDLLADTDAADPVEVVIELAGEPPAVSGSRQERIATLRRSFEHDVAAVTGAITAAGGQVTAAAWLNRTVLGTLPAGAVPSVAGAAGVAAVDLPGTISPEAHGSVSSP